MCKLYLEALFTLFVLVFLIVTHWAKWILQSLFDRHKEIMHYCFHIYQQASLNKTIWKPKMICFNLCKIINNCIYVQLLNETQMYSSTYGSIMVQCHTFLNYTFSQIGPYQLMGSEILLILTPADRCQIIKHWMMLGVYRRSSLGSCKFIWIDQIMR